MRNPLLIILLEFFVMCIMYEAEQLCNGLDHLKFPFSQDKSYIWIKLILIQIKNPKPNSSLDFPNYPIIKYLRDQYLKYIQSVTTILKTGTHL